MSESSSPLLPAGEGPRRTRRPLFVGLGLALAVALVVVAVGIFGGGGDDKAVTAGATGSTTTEAESGEQAIADDVAPDESIDLADDVVVVRSNGGKAVRSFEDDGATLVIDADAEGADELEAGEVLLLTGVTAARVASIERDGDDLIIEGAPIELTELIEDGELSWADEAVDFRDARVFLAGDAAQGAQDGELTDEEVEDMFGDVNDILGGEEGEEESSAPYFDLSGAELIAADDVISLSGKLPDDIAFQFTLDPNPQNPKFHTELAMGDDLKGTLTLDVSLEKLTHNGEIKVVNSELQLFNASTKQFKGVAEVKVQAQSTANVANAILPPFFKLPLKVEVPLVVAGIPFTFTVEATIEVRLSMAMANNTLNGEASFEFGGPAGFEFTQGGFTVNGKQVTEVADLLDTVNASASGPVGIVITAQLPKFGIGLGWGFIAKGGVFMSNGFVASFHVLPMPAPCTATNVAHIVAAGAEVGFLSGLFSADYRRAISDTRREFMVPQDGRCNAG
jgi:hypothetical protein